MKPVIQKIIVAGIVVNNGQVLIIQRSTNEDVYPGIWEVPSGKRELFETSEEAIIREVNEEVGMDVKPIVPVDVFEFRVEKENEIRDATQISFLCKTIGKPSVKLSSEHQNFAWVKEKELNEYNLTEEVREAIIKAFSILKKNRLKS